MGGRVRRREGERGAGRERKTQRPPPPLPFPLSLRFPFAVPTLTTGHDFLHSWRHFLGLHLRRRARKRDGWGGERRHRKKKNDEVERAGGRARNRGAAALSLSLRPRHPSLVSHRSDETMAMRVRTSSPESRLDRDWALGAILGGARRGQEGGGRCEAQRGVGWGDRAGPRARCTHTRRWGLGEVGGRPGGRDRKCVPVGRRGCVWRAGEHTRTLADGGGREEWA